MATTHITTQDFKDRIFNYDLEKEWNYKGDVPAIIDFTQIGADLVKW